MATHKDPWAMLGVERTADDATIKKAYRKLAREHHPDRHRGDQAKAALFGEIARAYESIETQPKRDLWLGHHEGMGAQASAFGPLGEDFYDTFGGEPNFPSAPAAAPRRAPRAVTKTVTVTFSQAYNGTNVELALDVEDACGTCGGSGAAPGHKPRMCTVCRGTGEHAVGQVSSPCQPCEGRGYTVEVPCANCDNGLVRNTRPFVIPVPAGVRDGQSIRLPGPGRGRGADVTVTVRVQPSTVFKRTLKNPADLLIVVPVSYTEACFGASVKVPTPEKTIALRVPAGTQSGKAFRIPGKGMAKPGADGERGDLYARVNVIVPAQLTGQQHKLVQQLGHYDDTDRLRAELFTGLRDT